jgi:hypothetical protein
MATMNVHTAIWQVRPQRPVTVALAAVVAATALAIAVLALKGQLPVHSLVHAFDRIPAPFRHGLFGSSGDQLVQRVAHHFAAR